VKEDDESSCKAAVSEDTAPEQKTMNCPRPGDSLGFERVLACEFQTPSAQVARRCNDPAPFSGFLSATPARGRNDEAGMPARLPLFRKRMMNKNKATLIGMIAVFLWSTTVGTVRAISEGLGPAGGAATIFTASAVLMILTSGFPRIGAYPRPYLYAGGLLFVVYEVFLYLALGYANNGRQAIEIGMLNYLWPSMTILLAILFTRQKASLLIVPGLLLSFFGVCWILGGDKGFHPAEMLLNVQDNPLGYSLALCSSLLWAAYCIVTVKTSRGQTEITPFLIFTSLSLWTIFFLGISEENPPMRFDLRIAVYVAMTAVAIGYGTAAWNIGVVHGNMTILALASYFTPVLSSALAAFLLSVPLSISFWQGAFLVCIGSLLCWISTGNEKSHSEGTRRVLQSRRADLYSAKHFGEDSSSSQKSVKRF
jgi:drug/metabolite transporter (DMT)-like permease